VGGVRHSGCPVATQRQTRQTTGARRDAPAPAAAAAKLLSMALSHAWNLRPVKDKQTPQREDSTATQGRILADATKVPELRLVRGVAHLAGRAQPNLGARA
jgi:hypothetical protein